jgi:hypothetical protein
MSTAEDDEETSRGTLLIVGGSALIIIGFAGISAYYFNLLRTRKSLSDSQIETGLVLNIILLIVAIVLLFFVIYRLLFSREYRQNISTGVVTYFTSPPTGIITPSPAAMAVPAPAAAVPAAATVTTVTNH